MILKLQQFQWWRRFWGGSWYRIRPWGLEVRPWGLEVLCGPGVWTRVRPDHPRIQVTDEEHWSKL